MINWTTFLQHWTAGILLTVFQITASPSARSRQLWRRTGNFLKKFLQFYVYDLIFKAAGLTTFLVEFWTLLLSLWKYDLWNGISFGFECDVPNFCQSLLHYTPPKYPPKRSLVGVYWIHPVRPSVCPSVCLSVRPSGRPWVAVRMITLILFSGFKIFFFTYITWVKILHGIEYQCPTSLNMRILADHVTYSFLAFPKSIF